MSPSEAKTKDAEIERLRELVAAGKDDRKAIDELVDENLRLRVQIRDLELELGK